jgi:hypothetical protein
MRGFVTGPPVPGRATRRPATPAHAGDRHADRVPGPGRIGDGRRHAGAAAGGVGLLPGEETWPRRPRPADQLLPGLAAAARRHAPSAEAGADGRAGEDAARVGDPLRPAAERGQARPIPRDGDPDALARDPDGLGDEAAGGPTEGRSPRAAPRVEPPGEERPSRGTRAVEPGGEGHDPARGPADRGARARPSPGRRTPPAGPPRPDGRRPGRRRDRRPPRRWRGTTAGGRRASYAARSAP